MIMLFNAICFIFTELSTNIWQNKVRRITHQVVEVMDEAEKQRPARIDSLFQVDDI